MIAQHKNGEFDAQCANRSVAILDTAAPALQVRRRKLLNARESRVSERSWSIGNRRVLSNTRRVDSAADLNKLDQRFLFCNALNNRGRPDNQHLTNHWRDDLPNSWSSAKFGNQVIKNWLVDASPELKTS